MDTEPEQHAPQPPQRALIDVALVAVAASLHAMFLAAFVVVMVITAPPAAAPWHYAALFVVPVTVLLLLVAAIFARLRGR